MTETAPFHITYNLNRLGQVGDQIEFSANAEERVKLARLVGGLEVPHFAARIGLQKTTVNRFTLSYVLTAEVVQACVVTLEPLSTRLTKTFIRELHFVPNLKCEAEAELRIDPDVDEAPEDITSLHYDLAGPLLEEFVLEIEPYPRAEGVAYVPPDDPGDKPDNPFAALKGLKSGPESTK
jgi:hypothetical protein